MKAMMKGSATESKQEREQKVKIIVLCGLMLFAATCQGDAKSYETC